MKNYSRKTASKDKIKFRTSNRDIKSMHEGKYRLPRVKSEQKQRHGN